METTPKMPTIDELNIMWAVATSSSLESGQRPHHIFARLLYNDLMDIQPTVGLKK
jgi:hypothetical protein